MKANLAGQQAEKNPYNAERGGRREGGEEGERVGGRGESGR